MGTAGGWLGRASSLLGDDDVAEQGYLLMPLVFRHEAAGDFESAAAVAAEARAIAARFGDAEALALTTQAHGYMLLRAGRVERASPCSTRRWCSSPAAPSRRSRPGWSTAPSSSRARTCSRCAARGSGRGCSHAGAASSPTSSRSRAGVSSTARRSSSSRARGTTRSRRRSRASARLAHSLNRGAAAQAAYRRGELHRLRGELGEAEAAYREASGLGWEPQPGLALLRVAQGRGDAALKALRRALDETSDPLRRATLLPALVEVALDAGEVDEARAACHELGSIVERYRSEMLDALVAQTRGAVELAGGDARAALSTSVGPARSGRSSAPRTTPRGSASSSPAPAARSGTRTAPRSSSTPPAGPSRKLGAAPDLARLDAAGAASPPHGLTARQLEVLRLVASGRTNREIATELTLSEHTVARHLQNIYASLGVSSRTAASAYAFEHRLV